MILQRSSSVYLIFNKYAIGPTMARTSAFITYIVVSVIGH